MPVAVFHIGISPDKVNMAVFVKINIGLGSNAYEMEVIFEKICFCKDVMNVPAVPDLDGLLGNPGEAVVVGLLFKFGKSCAA